MDSGQLGVGAAFLASGTSIGAIAAPIVVAQLAPAYGWRSVFVVCGVLGFLWVPLWLLTSKLVPPRFEPKKKADITMRLVLGDRRFWAVVAAYALSRQTLWVAWTTLYFVEARGLTMVQANAQFSWYPSVFGALGAFAVGAVTMRWIRNGASGLEARTRACWFAAPLLLLGAAVPFLPSAQWAAVAVGLSFVGSVCMWSSVHLLPIDLYGVGRSAFTYAVLEGSFTGLQTVASPAIGDMIDRFGFTPVCVAMPLLPLAGLVVLKIGLAAKPKIAHAV
jgi:ACS family hexuronate transporter-like MFS transporter